MTNSLHYKTNIAYMETETETEKGEKKKKTLPKGF